MIYIDGTYDEINKPPLFDSFCGIIMLQCIINSNQGFFKYVQGDHSEDRFRKEIVTLVWTLTKINVTHRSESWYFLTHPRELDKKKNQDMPQTQKIIIQYLKVLFNSITCLIQYSWWTWQDVYNLFFWKFPCQFQKYIRDESIFLRKFLSSQLFCSVDLT